MKIALLLGKYKESLYEGVNRPFLNWAKYLPRLGHSVYLTRISTDSHGYPSLKEPDESPIKWVFGNEEELLKRIKEEKIDVIIGDDKTSLPILVSVKEKLGVKSLSYVQHLYGIHNIGRCFETDALPAGERLVYSLSSLIPFKLITHSYISNLSKLDGVIANSKFTYDTLLLHSGIEALGVVYPPVDTEIFNPTNNPTTMGERQSVLLYMGSHGGDTSQQDLVRLVDILEKSPIPERVIALGSTPHFSQNSGKIILINGVDDRKLASLYSSSYLTLCPQRWEMFGYVPAESMMCGTPVLSLTPHEGIIDGKTGWIAYNSDRLKSILGNLLNNKYDASVNTESYRYARQNFSAEKSSATLLNMVERTETTPRDNLTKAGSLA